MWPRVEVDTYTRDGTLHRHDSERWLFEVPKSVRGPGFKKVAWNVAAS